MDTIKDIYKDLLPIGGFVLDEKNSDINENQYCYMLTEDKGKGVFWNYFYENMFTIQKQDFYFYEDYFLESPNPDFLAIQYYISVSGEEFHPYCQLSPNTLRTYIGGNGRTFKAVYHKNIPIRSVSISIMPAFYKQYLRDKFGDEYIDPQNAFKQITLSIGYPQLITLLKQIQSYSGKGIVAKMFYEGKTLESLALIIEKAKENKKRKREIHITESDEENLKIVANYLNNHYNFPVSLEQLSKIAYMGNTKLKTKFKEYFGYNISDYIIHKRIGQAQHLLLGTDLSITEVAKAVGYKRSDSFSKQFKKITGLLPREYRGLVNNNK